MASFDGRDSTSRLAAHASASNRDRRSTASKNPTRSLLDVENQRKDRSSHLPKPTKRRASSTSKAPQKPQQQTNENDPNNNAKANNNKSTQQDSQSSSMAQAMINQQRRRMIAGGQVAASILSPRPLNNINANTNNQTNTTQPAAWDGFVRKGTQLKSFLDEALQHVATGYAVTNAPAGSNKRQRLGDNDNAQVSNHVLERNEATALVAQEKTKQVMLLQQKLEEAQSQVATLKASNQTLREESTAASLRFERTIEALKIAAANAASARTDADQAEVSAECLATQLEALKTVVEQTKKAAQVLHEEQQEISEQAKSGQAKLLQVEAELARSQKQSQVFQTKAEEWQTKAKELQEESTTLKRQLADETERARKLTKTLEERDALEEARKKRSQQVEKELQEAQTLLVEASSAAADSDAVANLNESVAKLQEANKKLHEQLVDEQETAREDKERLRESLLVAEKEAQALRIEAKLKSDQDVGRRNSSGSDTTPFALATTNLNNLSTPTSSVASDHAVPPATTCSICFKAAFGLMKSCQCGKPDCDKRAHITCANRINPGPSVSHPGTPAAKLPIVLCTGALSDILTNQQQLA